VSEAHAPEGQLRGPALELTCRQVGDDVIVITVVGEVDMITAPQVRAYLQDKTAARPGHVVLDLGGVAFLGSHGLTLLVDAREGRDDIHGQLHLTGVFSNRPVMRVLDLAGLTHLLDIHDDQDQLVRQLAR
jgi:anti-anti-sigma factor